MGHLAMAHLQKVELHSHRDYLQVSWFDINELYPQRGPFAFFLILNYQCSADIAISVSN